MISVRAPWFQAQSNIVEDANITGFLSFLVKGWNNFKSFLTSSVVTFRARYIYTEKEGGHPVTNQEVDTFLDFETLPSGTQRPISDIAQASFTAGRWVAKGEGSTCSNVYVDGSTNVFAPFWNTLSAPCTGGLASCE